MPFVVGPNGEKIYVLKTRIIKETKQRILETEYLNKNETEDKIKKIMIKK